MKYKYRIITFLLAAILLCTTLVTYQTNPAHAASTTDVNLRMVIKYCGGYALCNVTLKRYESMTSQIPINDDSFNSNFTIRRLDNWEHEIKLEPGFYEVDYVSIPGLFDIPLTGYSERFEVKGDQMTVYVAVDHESDPVQMPDNWLIYGEDNQNFHVWETPETTTPTEPTNPSAPSVPDSTLPTVDTDVEPDPDEPSRETSPSTQTKPTNPDKSQEETKSAQIGNIIFTVLLLLVLGISIIALFYFKKKRGA